MTLSFMDSYTLWRSLPFPRSGKNRDLIMTHSDLAGADEYVTTVIRFVERGIHKPTPPQANVLELLADLLKRTERLCEELTGDEQELARFQHAYAALLDIVYRHFLDARPSESKL